MRARQIRNRIQLQQQTKTRNSMGGEIKTWVDVATVWTEKLHQSSREFFSVQKVTAEITDLFKIRYRQNIDTKMRLVFDGKIYDILGANDPNGRRRELWLMAKVVQ